MNDLDRVTGPGDLVLVAFAPSWLGVELDDTDGDRRTGERPETLRQVLARMPDVRAAIDGPMFEIADGKPYTSSGKARLLYRYLDRRRGVDVASRYPDRGATLSVTGTGIAVWSRGAREAPDAVFALQGFPELLRDGANVANPARDADVTGRAALVRLGDGRVGFAAGRASMHGFASALRGLATVQVTDAVYLDGGGSTALAARGADGALVASVGLDARRVPSYVLAVPPGSAWGSVVLALALGAGAWGCT